MRHWEFIGSHFAGQLSLVELICLKHWLQLSDKEGKWRMLQRPGIPERSTCIPVDIAYKMWYHCTVEIWKCLQKPYNASSPGLADSTAGLQLEKVPCSFGSPDWPWLQTRRVSPTAQLVFSVFVTISLSNTNTTETAKMLFQDSSMLFSLSDSLEKKKHSSVCFPVKS